MAHGDNRGLKLPPKVAPTQVVIVPIAQHKEGVLEKVNALYDNMKNIFRVKLDDRDNCSTGYKFNDWEMRGVPVRVEVGPKDLENGQAILVRRDTGDKETVELTKLNERIEELLEIIQKDMYDACAKRLEEKTSVAYTLDEMIKIMEENQGFIKTMWCGDRACEDKVKEVIGAPSRCMPFVQEHLADTCAICGKKATKMVVWGRQY